MDSPSSRDPIAIVTVPAASNPDDAGSPVAHDYLPGLSTSALVVEVRRQLGSERRAGRLVCRYLADLADRIRERGDSELVGDVDEVQAAACFFDLGARETRERVRIGRALRSLPQIEAAFIAGELSYSRVREVTRVARDETEAEWLALARDLDMRALEGRVARDAEGAAPASIADASNRPASDALDAPTPAPRAPSVCRASTDDACARPARTPPAADRSPAPPLASTPLAGAPRTRRELVHVAFELSTEAWALLERALEGARRRATTPLSDAEALEIVAREALAARNVVGDPSFDEPKAGDRRTVGADEPSSRTLEPPPAPSSAAPDKVARVKTAPPDLTLSSSGGREGLAEDIPHSGERAIGETTTHVGSSSDPAARLLGIIGRRRGWCLDELGLKSGMSIPELQHSLLLLELGGRIHCKSGWVDPVS